MVPSLLSGWCVRVKGCIQVGGSQRRTRRRHAPQLQTLIQWSCTAVPAWKNLCFKLHKDKFVSCPRVFYIQTRIWVKRAAVSVVKSQTIVSPPPTTSSHGIMLRFSRMQMGDVSLQPVLTPFLGLFPAWPDAWTIWALDGEGQQLHSELPLEVWAPHPLWEAVVYDPLSSFQSFASFVHWILRKNRRKKIE